MNANNKLKTANTTTNKEKRGYRKQNARIENLIPQEMQPITSQHSQAQYSQAAKKKPKKGKRKKWRQLFTINKNNSSSDKVVIIDLTADDDTSANNNGHIEIIPNDITARNSQAKEPKRNFSQDALISKNTNSVTASAFNKKISIESPCKRSNKRIKVEKMKNLPIATLNLNTGLVVTSTFSKETFQSENVSPREECSVECTLEAKDLKSKPLTSYKVKLNQVNTRSNPDPFQESIIDMRHQVQVPSKKSKKIGKAQRKLKRALLATLNLNTCPTTSSTTMENQVRLLEEISPTEFKKNVLAKKYQIQEPRIKANKLTKAQRKLKNLQLAKLSSKDSGTISAVTVEKKTSQSEKETSRSEKESTKEESVGYTPARNDLRLVPLPTYETTIRGNQVNSTNHPETYQERAQSKKSNELPNAEYKLQSSKKTGEETSKKAVDTRKKKLKKSWGAHGGILLTGDPGFEAALSYYRKKWKIPYKRPRILPLGTNSNNLKPFVDVLDRDYEAVLTFYRKALADEECNGKQSPSAGTPANLLLPSSVENKVTKRNEESNGLSQAQNELEKPASANMVSFDKPESIERNASQPEPSSSTQTTLTSESVSTLKETEADSTSEKIIAQEAEVNVLIEDLPTRQEAEGILNTENSPALPEAKTDVTTVNLLVHQEAISAVDVAVVLADYPKSRMTADQLRVLQYSIFYEAVKCIERPKFLDCFSLGGTLNFTCCDEAALRWLKNFVENLIPWEGARLVVVDSKDLPTLTLFSAWISGPPENPEQILQQLQAQNMCLDVETWNLVDWKASRDGQMIIVTVNEKEAKILEQTNLVMNFRRVRFMNLGPQLRSDKTTLEKLPSTEGWFSLPPVSY